MLGLPITDRTLKHPIRRVDIGSGRDAVVATMNIMKDIINVSAHNPYVRNWAEHLTEHSNNKDTEGRITAITDYLWKHTKYVRDPDGLEYIRTPLVALQQIESGGIPMLDCDDYTVLSLSLIKSLGIVCVIRATAYNGGAFEHVYGMVQIKKIWRPLDLTQYFGLGWEGPGATQIIDVEVK